MKTRICGRGWGILAILIATCPGAVGGALRSVSTTDLTNAAAAGSSYTPVFSGDGNSVVFVSHARNLVTNDDLAPYLNVFLRNLTTSNTVLVSVNRTGVGGGDADANFPSVSSNGQFVAFASAASNLVNGDTNDAPDIFVRDLAAGVTTLVSVDPGGVSSASSLSPWTRHRLSSNPLISADGRWVIFESFATNLVALPDTNQLTDLFARDLHSNTTLLVSVNAAGTGSGNGNSDSPSVTPDGRFVVFVSTSTDLFSGTTNQLGDVFVRDLQSGTTVWASRNAAGFFTNNYRCSNPAISADGHYVAFKASSTTDLNTVLLIRHDLQAGVSTVLTSNSTVASLPQLSTDGRFVASETLNDVYVWDLQTGSNILISVNMSGAGGGNQTSHTPVMTPDGRSVAFLSAATDLAFNATNGLSQVFLRDWGAGTTRLISVNLDGFASGSDIDVTLPAISADGHRVAFESMAGDLVASDLNRANDVFLRDLVLGSTELVSRRAPSLASTTASGLSTLFPRMVNSDGRSVAFTSFYGNMTPNGNDEFPALFARDLQSGAILLLNQGQGSYSSGFPLRLEPSLSGNGRYLAVGTVRSLFLAPSFREDISRFDLQTGTNELVSVDVSGTNAPNGNSSAPAISADGNLIAFQSVAQGLTSGSYINYLNVSNVFLRNMTLRTNQLVSLNPAGDTSASGHSIAPLFSPDDRWLVFASLANNLTTNATGGAMNLFARDLLSNTTRMISVGPDGSTPAGYTRGAVFSADSRHVAFLNGDNSVALYDFLSGVGAVVCGGCDNPSISADGQMSAYETPTSGGSPRDIVVQDLRTGLTNLISVNRLGTGGGNRDSSTPLLSWDGRYVVFTSKASDLVDNDTNNVSDIFVWDRVLGTTLLVSMNLQGTGSGNSASSNPLLAADGRTVVFQSFASDLVPGDYNYRRDVFVLRLGGPDTDGDGMDDDWEMAYFGTLDRDGKGDFDHDGVTDLQEFLAGTDPTNAGSVLRVLTLAPLGGGGTRVLWSAAPGKSYRVQFRDNLEGSAWSDLPGTVVANGTTASFLDNSAGVGNRRFYRVSLAQ